jgi:hypothetical protein
MRLARRTRSPSPNCIDGQAPLEENVTPLIAAAFAASIHGAHAPPTVRLDAHTLERVSCGVRRTLWIRHYHAALYVPKGASPHAAMDERQPKAVRVRILDSRYLPEQVPEKWRAVLAAELPPDTMARVQRVYGGLSTGDVLTFTYLPRQGLTMRVNGRVVARARGHAVVDSMLHAWAAGEPVPIRLDRLIHEHPC